jgi:hypothetical protein
MHHTPRLWESACGVAIGVNTPAKVPIRLLAGHGGLFAELVAMRITREKAWSTRVPVKAVNETIDR